MFEERAKIDGTIDKDSNLICDYNVNWFLFGRYIASSESGYFATFWGKILFPKKISSSDWTPFKDEWPAMAEKISIWQNDKEKIIEFGNLENPNPEYLEIGRIFLPTLHKLNLQARYVFSEERIQEIKRKNKVIEIVFKQTDDFPTSQ